MGKMQNLDRDKLDFGNGKIGALFRTLFFPTLIGMIFNSVLTLVDGMFVGHGVGANGIAAVNIVAPLFLLTTGIGLMFGIGASVIASIRLSENNVKSARIIMTQAFIIACLLVGLIGAVALVWSRETVYMLGSSTELEKNAIDYMLPLIPGLFFLVIECIGMMLIRLDGSPRYAMWAQVIPATLNIVLDYIMIFPMGMGVAGAAAATSISCGVGGLIILAYFIWFSDKLRFHRLKLTATSLWLTMRNVGYMAKIGFATFLTEGAMGIMMFTGNYAFMKVQGENGVAAFSIACYLFPVVFSISNAVAQSAQPIISYNYGAHQSDRILMALKVAMLTAAICGLTVTVLLSFGNKLIVAAFLSPDEPAFALANHGLPLFSICAVFFAGNITFIGYFQSIENAAISTFYTLLRGIIFLVPPFLILPRISAEDGPWLAIPVAEMLTFAVIMSVFLIKQRGILKAA